jgi:hypothetical protein
VYAISQLSPFLKVRRLLDRNLLGSYFVLVSQNLMVAIFTIPKVKLLIVWVFGDAT